MTTQPTYTRIEVVTVIPFMGNYLLYTFEYSDKGKKEAQEYADEVRKDCAPNIVMCIPKY